VLSIHAVAWCPAIRTTKRRRVPRPADAGRGPSSVLLLVFQFMMEVSMDTLYAAASVITTTYTTTAFLLALVWIVMAIYGLWLSR